MEKAFKALALGIVASLTFPSIAHANVCPAIGASSDCGFLIVVNPDGSITAGSTGIGPYDGIEDTLVGVRNDSGSALLSLSLSGSNIFGFDGDGQATFTGTSYDPSGYAGPNTAFSVLNPSNGTVSFLGGGVAPKGGTAWFTLEENLAQVSGGVTVSRGVPEPATWAMMLIGFCGIGLAARRRRRAVVAQIA